MGYRLEVWQMKYSGDCGGKLYGYISSEELHKCKSWQWLRDNGYLKEGTEDNWDYDDEHRCVLDGEDFKTFIKLYIKDFNKYSPYGSKLILDDFKASLDLAKKGEFLVIEWG